MRSVVVVDRVINRRERTLDRVVDSIKSSYPKKTIYRTSNYGEAMELIFGQSPAAVLIDAAVEEAKRICPLVKGATDLEHTKVVYYAGNKASIDTAIQADRWYVRGKDRIAEIIEYLKPILRDDISKK